MTPTERARIRRRHRVIAAAALIATPIGCAEQPTDQPAVASTASPMPDALQAEGVTPATRTPHATQRPSRPARRPAPSPTTKSPAASNVASSTTNGIPAVWLRLAHCESTSRWNYRGLHEGGLQFAPSTWDAYAPRAYPDAAYLATPAQQVQVGRLVLRAQGPGAWPYCSRVAGLTMKDAA